MKLQLIDFLNQVIYEQACSNIVKEGGQAVKGVSRIKKEFIIPTINHFIKDYLQPLFPVTCFEHGKVSDKIFLFGSTGKKTDSGDIDLALDLTKFSKKQNKQNLIKSIYTFAKKESFAMQILINPVTNDMIHFSYPQFNENNIPIGQTVQVDLFFCQYPNFTKFITLYPGQNFTKYKTAHRNQLLKAIATVVTKKNIFIDKSSYEVLRWMQEDINNDGVYLDTKTLVDDNGNRLKYKDTNEDLISSYAKVIATKQITHDPITCINRYIGNYKQKDVDSFQKLYNIIATDKHFKFANIKQQILYEAARRLKENTKLEFPQELQGILSK